jgi:hypothetical protein
MLKRILLVFAATLISFSLLAQQNINKTFKGVKEIQLTTGSGDCKVVKSNNQEVVVDLTYTYDDENYTPVLELDGDVLVLKEKFKNNRSDAGNSNWQLSVPDNIALKYNAGSGDLSIKEVSLDLNTNTGSGDIDAVNMSGSFTSNSGSGEVSIDNYKGELKINTGSGDIEVANSTGEFNINLGSGDIDAENISGTMKFNAGSGDINVEDVVITGKSSMNSGSGDARVSLKSDLQAGISINSGSGDATLDFNGLEVKGAFTMKANKKHGEISAPFEFDEVSEEKHGNQTVVTKKAKVGNSNIEIKLATGSGRASVQK